MMHGECRGTSQPINQQVIAMAKALTSRPSKEAKLESLLGVHTDYTISLRYAEPQGSYRKSAGEQYVIEGPKNEALIQHLRTAGARWDSDAKAWTIAKSKGAKLLKIVEQLPEIIAGQIAVASKGIDAVQDLLRPLSGFMSDDKRWYKRIAVELSSNGAGLKIYADVGSRTAGEFVSIGCKPEPDQYKHKTFWLPLSKHEALRDLIERLPSIWEAWAEETRQQIAAVVGTYGAYTVIRGQQGLLVKGPYSEQYKAAMNALRGYWDRGNSYWIIETSSATRLLTIMRQVGQWHAEDIERKRAAEEQRGSARKVAAAEREAEDSQVGRIYHTERNVERGYALSDEMWRDGTLYRLERVTYAGLEYEDGDWMVSGSYLPVSAEEQAEREEEIRQRQQARIAVEQAKNGMIEIAKQVATEPLKEWPATVKPLFTSTRTSPFCSIHLVDGVEGAAVVSYFFSDYDDSYSGSITDEQIAQVNELATIIENGGMK